MSYAENVTTIIEHAGSPIEVALGLALYHQLEEPFTIYQQKPIGKYRADFVVERNGRQVVVEADGHNFHERTKEQAAHDRQRDRWMAANGYQVLRFTGSEIWADALACVAEIDKMLPTAGGEYADAVGELIEAMEQHNVPLEWGRDKVRYHLHAARGVKNVTLSAAIQIRRARRADVPAI